MLNTFAKPFFVSLIAILALTLLVLLALASANTQFFDQYFTWLYVANIVIASYFYLSLSRWYLICGCAGERANLVLS